MLSSSKDYKTEKREKSNFTVEKSDKQKPRQVININCDKLCE